MNILTVGAAGVAAVLLAVWSEGVRGEYALYVVIRSTAVFPVLRHWPVKRNTGYYPADGVIYKNTAGVSGHAFKNDRRYLCCRICLRHM